MGETKRDRGDGDAVVVYPPIPPGLPPLWSAGVLAAAERAQLLNSCEHGVRVPRLAGMRRRVQHSHHSFQVSLDEIPHLPVCNLPV